MAELTIRLADRTDYAVVTACVKAAYAPYIERIGREPAPMTADYADLIARGAVSVLLEGGELRGVLVLKQEEARLWIENVAVHPGHQHRGIGRRLLAYAEQRARVAHVLEVRLYTHELMVENISLYRRLGYQEVERREEEGFRRVFMRKFLDSPICADRSITPWVDAAPPPHDLTLPPTVLEQCRQLLADSLGPVELTRSSGPSYLIPETISFEATVALVRSDAGEVESLRAANPGNWEPDEWAHLLEGRLGPWVMAVRDG